MRSERIFWGVALVTVGFLFLLDTFDILNVTWQVILAVALVGMGIGLLVESQSPSGKAKRSEVIVPRGDAQEARIEIEHGMGRLQIDDEMLPDAVMVSRKAQRIEKKVRQKGSRLHVELSPSFPGCTSMVVPWQWFTEDHTWHLGLTPDMPLTLKIGSGASQNDLDLTHLNITSLVLETGASGSVVELPENTTHTDVKIDAGAASVDVRVPKTVAARIKVEGAMADIDVDTLRFPKDGDVYQSPDYATAAHRADIRVDIGAGRLVID
jgi:hypothetical protein